MKIQMAQKHEKMWNFKVTPEIQIKMKRCHLKFIISAKLKNTFKLEIWFGRNSQGNRQIISKFKIFTS